MVQVPKEHVREALLQAAAQAFVELGYDATTMAAVAERAGSSVGNLYKYFPGKRQLFDAAVPPELVQELSRLTRARIRAMGAAKDIRQLSPGAEYHALAGELLDYCLANRAAVIVVLTRAEGTPFAGFREQFVQKLVEWALEYASLAYPALAVSAELRFALRHAYASFVVGVAEALQAFPSEPRAREVIALLTTSHQAGLKRLFQSCAGEDHAHSSSSEPSSVIGKTASSRARNAGSAGPSPSPARPRAGAAHRKNRVRGRG
jgi:AcrR family transcriptional regulator